MPARRSARRAVGLAVALALACAVPVSAAEERERITVRGGAATYAFTLPRAATLTFAHATVEGTSGSETWGFWVEGTEARTAAAYGGVMVTAGQRTTIGDRPALALPRGRYVLTTFGDAQRGGTVTVDVRGSAVTGERRVATRRVLVLDGYTDAFLQVGRSRRTEVVDGRPRAAYLVMDDESAALPGEFTLSVCVRPKRVSCEGPGALRREVARAGSRLTLLAPPASYPDGMALEFATSGNAAYARYASRSVVFF